MPIGYYGYGFFIFVLVCLLMVLYNYLFSDVKKQKKMLDEKENKLLRLYQSVEDALDDFHDSVGKSHTDIERQLKDLGELHAEVERNMHGLAAHAPSRIERHESAMSSRTAAPAVPPSQQRAASQYAQQTAPVSAPINPNASAKTAAALQMQQRYAKPVSPQAEPAAGTSVPDPQAVPVVQGEVYQPQSAPEGMAPPPSFRHVLMEAAAQVEAAPAPVSDRNEQILAMSAEGKTRSQIARDLGITLSEVDLVIGMNK